MKFDADTVNNQGLDESYRFYQQRFSNAANLNLIFVGNVDFLQMETLLSTHIASLPNYESSDQC